MWEVSSPISVCRTYIVQCMANFKSKTIFAFLWDSTSMQENIGF